MDVANNDFLQFGYNQSLVRKVQERLIAST
jgi:hypothetical protein